MATFSRRGADMAAIARAIERSPIFMASLGVWDAAGGAITVRRAPFDLPAGYERADFIILDWIAAEALRAGLTCLPI
jgi:hypothetical protein